MQYYLEDAENARSIEWQISRGFFNQRSEDLEGDLDVAAHSSAPVTIQPRQSFIPRSRFGHVVPCLLLQEAAHLGDLATSRARIIEEVTELARVRLDIGYIFLILGVALQDQDLVLWPTRLANFAHRGG